MNFKTVVISLVLVILFASVASSCPVCYGETDAHTASAVNGAIFSLLIVTGAVLSFIASFILYLRKRLKLSMADNSNEYTERKESSRQ